MTSSLLDLLLDNTLWIYQWSMGCLIVLTDCCLQVILQSVFISSSGRWGRSGTIDITAPSTISSHCPTVGWGSPVPHGTLPLPLADFWSAAPSIINSYVFQHRCWMVGFNHVISSLGHTPCPSTPSPHAGSGPRLHCAQQAGRRYRETKKQENVKGEYRSTLGFKSLLVTLYLFLNTAQ